MRVGDAAHRDGRRAQVALLLGRRQRARHRHCAVEGRRGRQVRSLARVVGACAGNGLPPHVDARAQLSVTDQMNSSTRRDDAFLSLRLQQPLYQGGGLAAQVRRTMAQRDAARGNLLTVQRNVLQDVDDAFVQLTVARAIRLDHP